MRSIQRFITAAILVAPLMVPTYKATAQMPPGATAPSGPIDIQANEQEFAGDQVIARGNVHVRYKDSLVVAPIATLMKDGGGNPQMAVFTGHPHLTQGLNKIDAEKLTFMVSTSKVIAEGRAHSEVISAGGKDNQAPAGTSSATKPTGADAPVQNDDDDQANTAEGARPKNANTANVPTASAQEKKGPPEKIVTDSDRQEYDRTTGKFEALGHVRVVHGNILVKSDKLALVYGVDGKPETAVFSGNVAATQDRNTTLADNMIYTLSTKRLQATGHVKSTVIQERKEDKDGAKKKTASADPLGMPSAEAAEPEDPKDDVVVITSTAQDFSNLSGRMSATGNVHVFYEDLVGHGPAAVLTRNLLGKADRVIFQGRSQITQPGKRWIGDHIEMAVATKKVLATGNTRAVIIKQQPDGKDSSSQLASKPGAAKTISATKVDATR